MASGMLIFFGFYALLCILAQPGISFSLDLGGIFFTIGAVGRLLLIMGAFVVIVMYTKKERDKKGSSNVAWYILTILELLATVFFSFAFAFSSQVIFFTGFVVSIAVYIFAVTLLSNKRKKIGFSASEISDRLKRNIIIDKVFWNEVHLEFRCVIKSSRKSVVLRYEISNHSGVQWKLEDCGITVKADLEDFNGNAVYTKMVFVDDVRLKENKVTLDLHINVEEIQNAGVIRISARAGNWTL